MKLSIEEQPHSQPVSYQGKNVKPIVPSLIEFDINDGQNLNVPEKTQQFSGINKTFESQGPLPNEQQQDSNESRFQITKSRRSCSYNFQDVSETKQQSQQQDNNNSQRPQTRFPKKSQKTMNHAGTDSNNHLQKTPINREEISNKLKEPISSSKKGIQKNSSQLTKQIDYAESKISSFNKFGLGRDLPLRIEIDRCDSPEKRVMFNLESLELKSKSVPKHAI